MEILTFPKSARHCAGGVAESSAEGALLPSHLDPHTPRAYSTKLLSKRLHQMPRVGAGRLATEVDLAEAGNWSRKRNRRRNQRRTRGRRQVQFLRVKGLPTRRHQISIIITFIYYNYYHHQLLLFINYHYCFFFHCYHRHHYYNFHYYSL